MTNEALISLDYTLHDLYALDSEGESPPALFHYPSRFQDYEVSPDKFIYHTGYGGGEDETPTDALVMGLAVRIMQQRYGFMAGKMSIIILDSNYLEHERGLAVVPKDHLGLEVHRTFAQLRPDQRPIVSFTASPNGIILDPGVSIAGVLPADCISHLPQIVDPEIHYELLSKRGLAKSGLPTPPSTVIDSLLQPDHVHDPARLEQEIERMTEPLDTYRIPYMLKLPQSVSGKGVFPVSSDADRASVKAELGVRLRGMLEQLTPENHHLNPCSLILQDYIPGAVVGLSFFATRKGRPIFVACCEQRFDEQGRWIGGRISYSDQAAQHRMFAETMSKAARFLHQKGYYGPAGVDILTTEAGQQYIVDLNTRVTGTYFLGPLAGHFTQRGLVMAAMVSEFFPCSRSDFEETFEAELRDGRLVIGGWTYNESIRLSHGGIAVGGRDASEMESLMKRVESSRVLSH